MDTERLVTLIDLSTQLPFVMDDEIKQEICFAETLIISCGHVEGNVMVDSSDSECDDTEKETSHVDEEEPPPEPYEIKDFDKPPTPDNEEEEDDDFHFFFFPDCKKSPSIQHSKSSILIENGLPKINPTAKDFKFCTCETDKRGNCTCHTKLPCKCGAKKRFECACEQREGICICQETPMPVCLCKGGDVCLCFPDTMPRIPCICEQIERPCICNPEQYPKPICDCKHKPKFHDNKMQSIGELPEELGEMTLEQEEEHSSAGQDNVLVEQDENTSTEQTGEGEMSGEKSSTKETTSSDQPPCECQKVEPVRLTCRCLKGKDCVCKKDLCLCEMRRKCFCDTDRSRSHSEASSSASFKSCDCAEVGGPVCTCEGKRFDCECFNEKKCTCGDPENCKCFKTCDCDSPCLCDAILPQPEECMCLKQTKRDVTNVVCTCEKYSEAKKKMKRLRSGKRSYRWCSDVDSRHTFFDYAYDRHDKIDTKVQEREMFKVLGLHDEVKDTADECPIHGVKAPPYVKKERRASIDCCSAVGGISICVETLGEDKDKFLVQVVSHASKEGAKTGTKLVGILDTKLHTLEENRTEHITMKHYIKERGSYLAICDTGYYNKVSRRCADRNVVKRLYHNFESSRNLLLEAANVVLLRYLAIRRHRGNVKTDTILINGLICESIYVCLGVSQAIVNQTPMFVVKVERHIIEASGRIHQSLTVLTHRGYMISHEWADNSYFCHVNPLLHVDTVKDDIEEHAPLREKWREDLQLLSDYLNFKSSRSAEGARYVAETGALTGTLRDYLQSILLLKPNDALHFTRHYFGSALSALDLPHDEYFDPSSKHVRYYFFEQ